MGSKLGGLGLGGIVRRRKGLALVGVLLVAYVGLYLIMSRCPAWSGVVHTRSGPVLVFEFFELKQAEYRNPVTGACYNIRSRATQEYAAFYTFLPLIALDAQLGTRYHGFLGISSDRGIRSFWGQEVTD